jgi:hypothetical protein
MKYELGRIYVDRGGTTFSEDQFLRWLNIPGSGMLNSPGIRALAYTEKISLSNLPAYLVLVTHHKSTDSKLNPWHDVVDLSQGQITYWGDSKFDELRRLDDFQGNAHLKRINEHLLEGERTLIPPILHFSKPRKGVVLFNGLCVLEKLEHTWFDDGGRPVRNYRAVLDILDCDTVSVAWLHGRAKASSIQNVDNHPECPVAWKQYKSGVTRRIDIWQKQVRSKVAQCPPSGSDDALILSQLTDLNSYDFERVVVAAFKAVKEVQHRVTGTRPTGDGGFDFFGTFSFEPPLSYEIHFRGEVKKYAVGNGVSPKEVSRLVARLSRREYGIFVTTSYFSEQAQREVLADGYPVHLMAGIDLVNMLRRLRIASRSEIRKEWLQSVLEAPVA